MLFCEICNSVVVANIAYNLTDKLNVARIFTVFDKIAEHVAENASEILVASIREETAAVGEHTNELAQQCNL